MQSTMKKGKGETTTYYHAVDDAPAPPRKRAFWFGWSWEMTAAVATLGCMAAVVIILYRMQDKPAEYWDFPINLNSTIAAFVTVAKSTALLIITSCVGQSKWFHFRNRPARLQDMDKFDMASRGPSGALQLLWRLRIRPGIAVAASLVTVIALGVDSFAQQVIRQEQQTAMVNSANASFWITDTYSGGTQVSAAISDPTNIDASSIDTRMQGAIYRGLYNIPSSFPFNCSSDCRWEDSYTTLGFTSECADVTKEALDTRVLRAPSIGQNGASATMKTPGGLTVQYNVSRTSYVTVVDVVGESLVRTKNNNEFLYAAEFARIAVLRMTNQTGDPEHYALGTNNTEVFECTLGFAGLEYSHVSASGSTLRIGERKVHRLGKGKWTDGGAGNLNNQTNYAVYNTTGLPSFHISVPDLAGLGDFFASTLFVGKTYRGETAPKSTGLGLSFVGQVDVGGLMARVAQSMTNQLHDGYADFTKPATGQSARAVAFVRVRWIWLLLPLFVSAAAVVLLAASMVRTAVAGTALWKSSALAMLYHDVVQGPEDQRYYLHTDVHGTEHLEELTRDVKVAYK